MSITVDLRVPLGAPPVQLSDFFRRCEEAGFDGVGVHDHHHTGWDAYVTMALGLSRTERLRLYPATSNPVTRHPLVLAALVNTLAGIAPGRTMLTLAPGFRSVEEAGLRGAMREGLGAAVTGVRQLLRGEAVRLGSHTTVLRDRAAVLPPLFVLASGPRLLELAGEVADGVMMLAGLHPASVEAAREHVRMGARRAGRDPSSLQEILIVPTAIEPFDSAREWPRRWFRAGRPFLTYPSPSNLRWLAAAGIQVPPDHRPEDLSRELAGRICDSFGLFGPPEHCAERLLRAREETGLTHVFLFPSHVADTSYDLPHGVVDAFRQVIRPRLDAACEYGG